MYPTHPSGTLVCFLMVSLMISKLTLNSSLHRTSTTEMEVTSIRLERELKERLKELADKQGYQALIRDILWDYVHQRSQDAMTARSPQDIRATVNATAQQEEQCWLSGQPIGPQAPMLLGLTTAGEMVPLTLRSLDIS